MFNFKKKTEKSTKHVFKDLAISLPSNWKFETEDGEIEACFDPDKSSTFRIHVMRVSSTESKSIEGKITDLTGGQKYTTLENGFILTNTQAREVIEQGIELTVYTRRLIHLSNEIAKMAILTYTFITIEKDSIFEKETIAFLEEAMLNAEFI